MRLSPLNNITCRLFRNSAYLTNFRPLATIVAYVFSQLKFLGGTAILVVFCRKAS